MKHYSSSYNFQTGDVDVFIRDYESRKAWKLRVSMELIMHERLARMDPEGYRGAILLTPEEAAIAIVKRSNIE